MDATDAVAVKLARAGDQDAFRVLVERHSRAVFKLAYRVTGSESDAEDVVQETFLKAWRQLPRFEERSSFGTWVYRVGVNCALDHRRRRPGREVSATPVDSEGPVAGEETAAGETWDPERQATGRGTRGAGCTQAMDELSPAERTAFVLRHFEGRSIEEIGQIDGAADQRDQAQRLPGRPEDAADARTAGGVNDVDQATGRTSGRRGARALPVRREPGRRGGRDTPGGVRPSAGLTSRR